SVGRQRHARLEVAAPGPMAPCTLPVEEGGALLALPGGHVVQGRAARDRSAFRTRSCSMPHRIHARPLVLAIFGIVWTALPQSARGQETTRPHIVHIVADDLGWRDVGFHGSPDV